MKAICTTIIVFCLLLTIGLVGCVHTHRPATPCGGNPTGGSTEPADEPFVSITFADGIIAWDGLGERFVALSVDGEESSPLPDNRIDIHNYSVFDLARMSFGWQSDGQAVNKTGTELLLYVNDHYPSLSVWQWVYGDPYPQLIDFVVDEGYLLPEPIDSSNLFRGWFADESGSIQLQENVGLEVGAKAFALYYPAEYVQSCTPCADLEVYFASLRVGDQFAPEESICTFEIELSDESSVALSVLPQDIIGYDPQKCQQTISIPLFADRICYSFEIKPALVIDHIEVEQAPVTSMWLHEPWSQTQDGVLGIFYTEEGVKDEVPITVEMLDLSTFDRDSEDEQFIRVVYQGFDCTFRFVSVGPKIVSMSIISQPYPLSNVGQDLLLDDSGVLRVNYLGGVTDDMVITTDMLDLSQFDKTTSGQKEIPISYGNGEFTSITVSFYYAKALFGWFALDDDNILGFAPIDATGIGDVYCGPSFLGGTPLLVGSYSLVGARYVLELEEAAPSWINGEWTVVSDSEIVGGESQYRLSMYAPVTGETTEVYYRSYSYDEKDYISYYYLTDLGYFISGNYLADDPSTDSPLYTIARFVDSPYPHYRLASFGGCYLSYVVTETTITVATYNARGEVLGEIEVYYIPGAEEEPSPTEEE